MSEEDGKQIAESFLSGINKDVVKCFEKHEVYPKDEMGDKLCEHGIRCVNDKFFDCIEKIKDERKIRRLIHNIYNEMEKYHGYSNYETWAMDLWLSNDYGTYNHIKNDIIPSCEEEAEDEYNVEAGIWTKKEAIKYCVVERIQNMVEENMPEVEDVWADLLMSSFNEINWDEIAETFIEE